MPSLPSQSDSPPLDPRDWSRVKAVAHQPLRRRRYPLSLAPEAVGFSGVVRRV